MKIPEGTRFGRLVVLVDERFSVVRCRCDCGTEKVVARANLRSGRQVSCGCYRKENHERRCAAERSDRERRFWSQVDRRSPDECWPWTGSRDEKGYGRAHDGDRPRKAHNLAYEYTYGPIPEGLEPDHTCHDAGVCRLGDLCPHRPCCNPTHLEAVTHQENCQRAAYAINTCSEGHELPAPAANGRRVCRPCANRRSQAYKRRKAVMGR